MVHDEKTNIVTTCNNKHIERRASILFWSMPIILLKQCSQKV